MSRTDGEDEEPRVRLPAPVVSLEEGKQVKREEDEEVD